MIERFRLLLEQLKLSPSEFADLIGVQRSSISHVLSGRNKPSIEFLEKILAAFPGTDINWLITGRIISTDNSAGKSYVTEIKGDGNRNTLSSAEDIKDPPEPGSGNSVDQIILVYKNGTFRILRPA